MQGWAVHGEGLQVLTWASLNFRNWSLGIKIWGLHSVAAGGKALAAAHLDYGGRADAALRGPVHLSSPPARQPTLAT